MDNRISIGVDHGAPGGSVGLLTITDGRGEVLALDMEPGDFALPVHSAPATRLFPTATFTTTMTGAASGACWLVRPQQRNRVRYPAVIDGHRCRFRLVWHGSNDWVVRLWPRSVDKRRLRRDRRARRDRRGW